MGLERLFGKGKYKLISVFVENKDGELHFREICRIAKLTEPTVKEHLNDLFEIGFLRSRKNKNQKLYSVDPDKPISKKILSMFEK